MAGHRRLLSIFERLPDFRNYNHGGHGVFVTNPSLTPCNSTSSVVFLQNFAHLTVFTKQKSKHQCPAGFVDKGGGRR
jgi:hypothetical protein